MILSALVFLSVFASAAQAGKRGLCWTWYDGALDPGVFNNGNGGVVAIYDYETYLPSSTNGTGGLNFIGMQRCLDCSSSPIADLYSRSKSQGWEIVFTLNEPDMDGTTPGDAASWYIEHISPLDQTIKKALPAVTSSMTSGQGLSWVSEMITACNNQCSFDYLNLHWYGNSFSQFQSYIESVHTQFPNYQMVISEFALQNPPTDQAAQISFFKEAFSFLDDASYVHMYFPFLATSPSLFEQHDPLGASYVGRGSCLYNDDGTPSAVGDLMY